MPSPPRIPRGSPPRRAALHERSDSQANEKPVSSLRVVGNPEASIYDSTPYPTKPSQILRPSQTSQASRLVFENTSQPASENAREPWVPSYATQRRKTQEVGQDEEAGGRATQRSSADVSFYSTSSNDSVPSQTADLNTNTSFLTSEEGKEGAPEEGKGRVSADSVVQLPSVPPRAVGHSLPSSWADPNANLDRQPVNKESDGSLSSANSTGTVIVRKNRDGRKRASYSAFPFIRPNSSKSNLTITTTPPKSARRPSDASGAPRSPVSPSSPVSSSYVPSNKRRISSLPGDVSPEDAPRKPVEFQYPVIKPQSVSASWAESSSSSQRPPRAAERVQDRWNPHLSTVHSEGTSSLSGERSSQSTMLLDSSRASKSSSNILSNSRVSSDLPPVPGRISDLSAFPLPVSSQPPSSLPPNLPNAPPIRPRDFSGSTIRVVSEQESQPERKVGRSRDASAGTIRLVQEEDEPPAVKESPESGPSAPQTIHVIPSENTKNAVPRPGSRASFFRDSIPAWAKAYYARPASSMSASRPESKRISTSTDNISLNIFRSRPRDAFGKPRQLRRSKLKIGPKPSELDLAEAWGRPGTRISPSWSPHLWHDRTSVVKRRSVFLVPSIDERTESNPLSRRNIQVLCFAFGFILPITWFIASILPLPHRPPFELGKGKEKEKFRQTQLMDDLENELGLVDDARYENARWWRNINRMLSLVGLIIIAAIIALAVVGAT